MSETIPIFVVATHPRKDEKELSARGFGWPENDEPAKLNQEFVEEMQRLSEKINTESIEPGTQVAELTVDRPDNAITSVKILVDDSE